MSKFLCQTESLSVFDGLQELPSEVFLVGVPRKIKDVEACVSDWKEVLDHVHRLDDQLQQIIFKIY